MATGIQTGMRATGSRPGVATGRGAGGKPPGAGLGKLKDIWQGLGKGAKIGIGALVAVAITGAVIFSTMSAANKDVDLYTTKLSTQDVNDCAAKLTDLGIDHKVKITGDGIMIHPKVRAKALAQLASAGLPRHSVMTSANAPEGGINAKTSAEQKAMRQHILEGDLTEALRQVEGVADAYVKIAAPEETYFRDDAKPITATVLLKLVPGTTLNEKQITGIVHLISFSVPELDKKNVKLVDTNGVDLTANIEEEADGGVAPTKQADMEKNRSNELTKKAQALLDDSFGKGKTKVAVTAEYDFAQTETNAKTVGGPADGGTVVTGRQIKQERYAKDPAAGGGAPGSDPAQQMSEEGEQAGAPPSGKDKNANYDQTVESTKVDYNVVNHKTVRKAPELKRLSCSVAVDNLKKDQVDKIASMVGPAIGLDLNRGDQISVVSVPFNHAMAGPVSDLPNGGVFPNRDAQNTGLNQQWIGMMLFGPAMVMLAFFAVFLLKQHRVQVSKSQPVVDLVGGGTTSSDISDLVTDKSGRGQSMAETKVNTTDALEKLAKEKPTKVAEMLKSTWLSG